MAITGDPAEVNRRAFLARGIGAGIAFLATLLGIPLVGASVGPALRRVAPDWVPLGRVDAFPEATPTSVEFSITLQDGWIQTKQIKAVWVVKQGADQVTVFNGRCTHLGCAYHWESSKNQFLCPCHAGVFAKDGSVVSGPPPRGLDPLPSRITAGMLEAQYADFRLGISDRVPS